MKRFIGFIMLLMIVAGVTNISAQAIGKKHLEKIETQVEEIATVMGLDDAQKAKVLEYKKESALEAQAVNKKYEKGSDDYKAAKKEIQTTFHTKLKALSTKEQMKLWSAHKKSKKQSIS